MSTRLPDHAIPAYLSDVAYHSPRVTYRVITEYVPYVDTSQKENSVLYDLAKGHL